METQSTDREPASRHYVLLGPMGVARRVGRRATGAWWTHVLLGLVVIALGVFALASEINAVSTMIALVGVLLLCSGGAEIAIGSTSLPRSWLAIVAGTASIMLGTCALAWPGATLYVVAIFVGISLLAWGVYDVCRSVTDSVVKPRLAALVLGLALAALGVLVLVHPTFSAVVLGMLVGTFLIIQGVLSFGVGLRLLDLHRTMRRLEKRFEGEAQVNETRPNKAA